jgi:hypothetical protein
VKTVGRRSTSEFRFKLDERRTNQVRLLLSNAILLMTDERLLASRVAMTGAELMDCVMRILSGTELCLYLHVEPTTRAVRLELETNAAPERTAELETLIAEISRDEDREVYIRALRKAQEEGPASLELRLARIRFEGKMSLRCGRGPARQLRVIAENNAADAGKSAVSKILGTRPATTG